MQLKLRFSEGKQLHDYTFSGAAEHILKCVCVCVCVCVWGGGGGGERQRVSNCKLGGSGQFFKFESLKVSVYLHDAASFRR